MRPSLVRTPTRSTPQSPYGTNPMEATPTAALPIIVNTTRRERFMMRPSDDSGAIPGAQSSLRRSRSRKLKPSEFAAPRGQIFLASGRNMTRGLIVTFASCPGQPRLAEVAIDGLLAAAGKAEGVRERAEARARDP